ncbi:MAG: NYN domain-containing protein [Desulfobacteraceae bacterium]|nr:NYN domain-containing protein [Desulfobacteraceae bacterium]
MAPKKVTYLIDGFNLYHSVRQAQRKLDLPTKWLNIRKLCESRLPNIGSAVGSRVELGSIYYFSAYAYHMNDPLVVERHRNFVKCLKDTGVQVEINRFKTKEIQCPFCKKIITKHEEKETDVSMAVKLLEICIQNECDVAALMTGDTDLAPAVRTAKRLCPEKHIFFIFPAYRKNKELDQLCPGSMVIKPKQYHKHQFSDPYKLKDGIEISKPPSW